MVRKSLAIVGSVVLMASLAVTAPPAASTTIPKKTECATDDPFWVREGIRVMQSLGPASNPGQISPEFFSMEIAPEITEPVGVNPGGYQRLWDMGVAWKDVNPAFGVFDWSVLDERVRQAEAAGAKPMYVLGLTPQWAALNPNAGDPRWGLGTASAPTSTNIWLMYVREVANRYNGKNGHGKIDAFEVWNEANIVTFWDNGDENSADPYGMGLLAQMTKIAYDEIKAANPDATVISATTTTRVRGKNDFFGGPQKRYWYYLEALKAQNYPFDAWGIHSYPAGNAGPTERIADVTCWQEKVVRHLGEEEVIRQVEAFDKGQPTVLGRPIFDTELNFGLAGPGPIPGASYTGDLADRMIWRAYIDSARLGIDSTTWYLYTDRPYTIGGVEMGVQMYNGTSTPQYFMRARNTLLRGGKFLGCGNLGRGSPPEPTVKTCRFAGLATYAGVGFEFGGIDATFLMFAENVFGTPYPTVPFIAGAYESLTPPLESAVEAQVLWADGRPTLIEDPRATNPDFSTDKPGAPTLTTAKFASKERVTIAWKAPEGSVNRYRYQIFYCPSKQKSGFIPNCINRGSGWIPGDKTQATVKMGARSPGGRITVFLSAENMMGEGPLDDKTFRFKG